MLSQNVDIFFFFQQTVGKQGRKSLFAQQMALSSPMEFGVALQQEVQKHGELSSNKTAFDHGRHCLICQNDLLHI